MRFVRCGTSGERAATLSMSAASGASARCCRLSATPRTSLRCGKATLLSSMLPEPLPTPVCNRCNSSTKATIPSASFKDNGMTAGVAQARKLGMNRVACVSTGNTSASMAAYAAAAEIQAIIFVPHGNIAYGKLAQALEYGAVTLQVEANFDQILALVRKLAEETGIYLLNSINPFRIEGQKTIAIENARSARMEGSRLDRAAGRKPRERLGPRKIAAGNETSRFDRSSPAGGRGAGGGSRAVLRTCFSATIATRFEMSRTPKPWRRPFASAPRSPGPRRFSNWRQPAGWRSASLSRKSRTPRP